MVGRRYDLYFSYVKISVLVLIIEEKWREFSVKRRKVDLFDVLSLRLEIKMVTDYGRLFIIVLLKVLLMEGERHLSSTGCNHLNIIKMNVELIA